MELIGKLKEKISKAKSKDEAKDIMEDAGMRLTDDELDVVAGGGRVSCSAPEVGSSASSHNKQATGFSYR